MPALHAAPFFQWRREVSVLASRRVAAEASSSAAREEPVVGSMVEVPEELEVVLVVEVPGVVLVAGSARRPAELGQAR